MTLFTELPRETVRKDPTLVISKNEQFASCAGALKPVGSLAVTGLVGAVNSLYPARLF